MPTELKMPVPAGENSLATAPDGTGTYKVLGVRVDAVQIPDAIARVEQWIAARGPARYVAVTGMHGVTEAQNSPRFASILREAGLVVSDGMPLVWLGRWHGYDNMKRRVYGPELTDTFFRVTGSKYRHFFYGGAPGRADEIAQLFHKRDGIQVAGTYCPPFRPLTPQEDKEVVDLINGSGADIVWVGLSTPKQETWMYEHRKKLSVPVMFGIGAAFDLCTGKLKQAPSWMREHGLEWLFRLLAEPRRLFHRYVVLGPVFAWNVSLELLGIKAFE